MWKVLPSLCCAGTVASYFLLLFCYIKHLVFRQVKFATGINIFLLSLQTKCCWFRQIWTANTCICYPKKCKFLGKIIKDDRWKPIIIIILVSSFLLIKWWSLFLNSIYPVIRKLAFLVLKEVRVLCSLMDLTDKVLETFIDSTVYFLLLEIQWSLSQWYKTMDKLLCICVTAKFFQYSRYKSCHDNHVLVVMLTFLVVMFSPGKIWESCAWCGRPSVSNSPWESSAFHSTEWEGTALFYLCLKNCWLPEIFKFTAIKSVLYSFVSSSQDLWVMWTS